MIPRPADPLLIALDVSDLDRAEELATTLAPHAAMLKVGLELAWAHGPEGVRRIMRHAPVFVDAKLYDIPTTMERAAANIARLGVRMFNVHALAGEDAMRAAREGALRGSSEAGVPTPLVIAVVVLSSNAGEGLALPASLAFEAKTAGLDGVVVSGEDVKEVRGVCGEAFCLAVPGIRPEGSNGHEHARILTPRGAVDAGADYLIVGRPITDADDPAAAARAMVLQAG